MTMRLKAYYRPGDWESVNRLLGRKEMRTEPLFLGLRSEPYTSRRAEEIVDLQALGLSYVTLDDSGAIHIGSLTSVQALAESIELQSRFGGLVAVAARRCACYGLRNLATIGGVIISHRSALGLFAVLLVLEADVVLRAGGERHVPLRDFAGRQDLMQWGEAIVEVVLPDPADRRAGAALESVARTPMDEPIVAVAAMAEADPEQPSMARTVHVAVAQSDPRPTRMMEAEYLLRTQPWSEALVDRAAESVLSALPAYSDYRGSTEYRRAVAGVLTRRALTAAWRRAFNTLA